MCDSALVDLAVITGRHIGSRAVWEAEKLMQVVAARASVKAIGLSNIIAQIQTIEPEDAMGASVIVAVKAQYDHRVKAAIGPGMIETFYLQNFQELPPGKKIRLAPHRPAVIALDGEREHVLRDNDQAEVQISLHGPYFIKIKEALLL